MNLLKSPGAKISAIFVGMALVLSLFVLVLTSVKLVNNRRLNRELKQLRATIENIRVITEDEKGFSEECEKTQKRHELSLAKIPKEAQIPQAIDQLTSTIEYLNLKLISIEPKKAIEIGKQKEIFPVEFGMGPEMEGEFPPGMVGRAETKPDYVQIPIKIHFRGSYSNIGQYLDSLRYLPRLITVEEIDIEKTKNAGILNAKLIVSVFYSEK